MKNNMTVNEIRCVINERPVRFHADKKLNIINISVGRIGATSFGSVTISFPKDNFSYSEISRKIKILTDIPADEHFYRLDAILTAMSWNKE